MRLRKLLKVVFGLITLLAVTVGLTSVNHPILLKWVAGSARHLGKPATATVYTNGQVNDHIRVFYSDEPNSYLLRVKDFENPGMYTFLNINPDEKWIGRPVATSKNDYDLIGEDLFQSEAGGHFSHLQVDMKGFTFDPHFSVTGKQIKFIMPPGNFKFDSIRINFY